MKFFFTALLVGALALFGLHACGVIGSVATAPGRVVAETMKTGNVITSYEWFYDVNAQYEARVNQVREYEGFMAEETDAKEKARLRTEVSAVRQSCRDLVTKYNANSEKVNKAVFKSNNLPSTLSITTCEAN